MGRRLPASITPLLIGAVQRFATCWKVECTNGTTLLLTDHSQKITLNDELYEPEDAFNASARQKQGNLEVRNLDLVGFLSSDKITQADLRAGVYREAKVTGYLVDWLFPDSVFETLIGYMADIRYDGEQWTAVLTGVSRYLQSQVGKVYTRFCSHKLGDAICRVDLDALTETRTVIAISKAKLIFAGDGSSANGLFNAGLITWTVGNNAGYKSQVRKYTATGDVFELELKTLYAIQVGDEFEVYPGCDKQLGTCKTAFDNVVNFGGFPYIPGSDKMYATPDRR